jgi:hypothetical protein
MKNQKIAENSQTTKAKHKFGILRIFEFFDVRLTKFKNSQNLLYKISDRNQLTTKLFIG